MNINRKYLLGILIVSVMMYLIVSMQPADAAKLPVDKGAQIQAQIIPTATLLTPPSPEISTTDPVFIQIIIVLGIFAVLVIFLGVWINRHQVDMK